MNKGGYNVLVTNMLVTLTRIWFSGAVMKDDELYRRFGELVREHRQRLGVNQAVVAEQAGLSRASIANIETGRQRIPFHHLYSLARALQVDAHALLPAVSSTPPRLRDVEIQSSIELSESEQREVAKVLGALASDGIREKDTK